MATLVLTMVLDPRRDDAVLRTLRDEVLPWVRRLPGFAAGRWLLSEDRSCCLVVLDFDTADDARAVARLVAEEDGDPARAWNFAKVVLADQVAVTSRPPALGSPT